MGILTNFIDRWIATKNAALDGAKQGAKEGLQDALRYLEYRQRAEMERKQKVREQMQSIANSRSDGRN